MIESRIPIFLQNFLRILQQVPSKLTNTMNLEDVVERRENLEKARCDKFVNFLYEYSPVRHGEQSALVVAFEQFYMATKKAHREEAERKAAEVEDQAVLNLHEELADVEYDAQRHIRRERKSGDRRNYQLQRHYHELKKMHDRLQQQHAELTARHNDLVASYDHLKQSREVPGFAGYTRYEQQQEPGLDLPEQLSPVYRVSV